VCRSRMEIEDTGWGEGERKREHTDPLEMNHQSTGQIGDMKLHLVLLGRK
jgi:hypothetical protein